MVQGETTAVPLPAHSFKRRHLRTWYLRVGISAQVAGKTVVCAQQGPFPVTKAQQPGSMH